MTEIRHEWCGMTTEKKSVTIDVRRPMEDFLVFLFLFCFQQVVSDGRCMSGA